MTTAVADVGSLPREISPGRRALLRLARRRGAVVALGVVVFFAMLAFLATQLAPFDPLATSWSAVRKAPSAAHWFGTDEIGRDVLSRVIWGSRASLLAGMVSVSIALVLGVPIGLTAGYVGGWLDALISRMTDAMLACPFLILAIALAAFLGPSLTNAMIAIGISATPIFIRLTRAQTLHVKVEDYVEAARAVGNSQLRIALRHVLPNVVPPLIVQATLAVAAAVIAEAALSFLGLGQHAQHGEELHRQCAVDGGVAGAFDLPAGLVVQLARRRTARRVRPEESLTRFRWRRRSLARAGMRPAPARRGARLPAARIPAEFLLSVPLCAPRPSPAAPGRQRAVSSSGRRSSGRGVSAPPAGCRHSASAPAEARSVPS